jgi:hypothetical protein
MPLAMAPEAPSTEAPSTEAPGRAAPAAAPAPIKKGGLVRVNRQRYQGSLEAGASDSEAPDYIFEGPGEVLQVKGDYAQLRWRRPVPDVWLRLDQLETYPAS